MNQTAITAAPLVFVVPRLPPAVCGVGDYTRNLIREMQLAPDAHFLVMEGAAATREAHPEWSVEQIDRSGRALRERLRDLGTRRLVLQYSGHGFQPRGCPLWLLTALRRWRRETPGARLVIMYHELWFLCPWWQPDFLLQRLHERGLRRLSEVADTFFVSTPGFAEMSAPWKLPGGPQVLPSGSNVLPIAPPGTRPRKPGQWILFGRQGSRLETLRRLRPWLPEFFRRGMCTRLQIAGAREGGETDRAEDTLLAELLPESAIERFDYVGAEALSALLLEAEIGLCGQNPGAWAKSTIFMAYAAHGVNILARDMRDPGLRPLSLVTPPEELQAGGPGLADTLRERSAALARWFEDTASPRRIAAAYRKALG